MRRCESGDRVAAVEISAADDEAAVAAAGGADRAVVAARASGGSALASRGGTLAAAAAGFVARVGCGTWAARLCGRVSAVRGALSPITAAAVEGTDAGSARVTGSADCAT